MKSINIGGKGIGLGHQTFIIAEAGVNHNGNLNIAKEMIDVAVKAKVDAIKFQTFKTENLMIKDTPKAKYQKDPKHPEENFYKLLKKLEFSFDQFVELKQYCDLKEIIFLSTPFDNDSVNFLEQLNIGAYKISSGDFDNFLLLKQVISKNKPILISSGMATLDDVKKTMKFFNKEKFEQVILFQCTSAYPTPYEFLNLKVITSYLEEFPNHIIGFSDHSPGTLMGSIAVSLGAKIIEKHFTLDQNFEGPDHKASLNPDQLIEYVKNIRDTELALGNPIKVISSIEKDVRKVARKSIVSKIDMTKGDVLNLDNITVKRPGSGIVASEFFEILGKTVNKDIKKNSIINWEDIDIT